QSRIHQVEWTSSDRSRGVEHCRTRIAKYQGSFSEGADKDAAKIKGRRVNHQEGWCDDEDVVSEDDCIASQSLYGSQADGVTARVGVGVNRSDGSASVAITKVP